MNPAPDMDMIRSVASFRLDGHAHGGHDDPYGVIGEETRSSYKWEAE